MPRDLRLRLLLVGAGVLAIPVGFIGSRPIEVTLDTASSPTSGAHLPDAPTSLDSLRLAVINRNPLRMSRSPADVAYSLLPAEPPYVEPPPPKPQLVLTGILWSDEPSAIVEGLPGVEGARVLRVGESSGSIRIRRITRQDVTLVGMDTTWVLQVRKPW